MKDEEIIHLYVLDKCTHKCPLCCNRQYEIDQIPSVTHDELEKSKIVLLTGGEPFLIDGICDFAEKIKAQYKNIESIYVYSSGNSLYRWLDEGNRLHGIDGVNLSPKNTKDAECVFLMMRNYKDEILSLYSNRLYLFPEVYDKEIYGLSSFGQSMKDLYGRYESFDIIEREWQEDFKPASGIFRRLPILLD